MQWNIHHLKMYFLLKMMIFHCYVSLLECNEKHGEAMSIQSLGWISFGMRFAGGKGWWSLVVEVPK